MNEFEQRIKNIESELLSLKTASEYTSTRSAHSSVVTGVFTGIYRVEYEAADNYIVSNVGCAEIEGTEYIGVAYPRTPTLNTQLIEIDTDYRNFDTGQLETGTSTMLIVSNYPIKSIARIS